MNNAIAQATLAKRLGRKSVLAPTGAGNHGVATVAACAKLSLDCAIFMGSRDIEKKPSNVMLMKLLGAEVQINYFDLFRYFHIIIPNILAYTDIYD